VYGESFEKGWRATCDGHDLGAPVPMQGYANAWPLDAPGCRTLDLRYAPNRFVTPALALSAIACLLLLAFVALRRRRREHEPLDDAPLPDPDPAPRLSLPAAVAIAIGAALVIAFAFALRAGAVALPLVALVLWRGVGVRRLTIAAGALLAVVVPVLYVVHPGNDDGGYDTAFASEHVGAHWVAVAAYVMLAAALIRTLLVSRARGRRDGPAAEPADAAAPRSAP
jgi:arabinofuranan 3-O-arabinosyltransferase